MRNIRKTYYWSRVPGKFVNKETGQEEKKEFNGTVAQWYEGLVHIVNDIIGQNDNVILKASENIATILLLGNLNQNLYNKLIQSKKQDILPSKEDCKIFIEINNNVYIVEILDLHFI